MAIGDIIVGIDIGTSKVCAVVGEVNNFGQIEIICNTSYKCSGLKKGKIINEEEVILSLAKTIKDTEEETNLKINSAYVTIPGKYVTIVQNSITREVKDKYAGISMRDVQNAIMQIKDIEIPEGETLIDIVPNKITLENGTVVTDPVGSLSSAFTINAQVIYSDFDSIDGGTFTARDDETGLAYLTDEYVCYSCGSHLDGGSSFVPGIKAQGIGVFFNNKGTWETGSSVLSDIGYDYGSGALTSLFFAARIDDKTGTMYKGNIEEIIKTNGQSYIDKYLLKENSSGTSLSKEIDNVKIEVTPELMKNKKFIKLNYKITNDNSENMYVDIATYNDVYVGPALADSVCNDAATYKTNTHIPGIQKGFNAIVGGGKYMTVVLQENGLGGIINDGGGEFTHYFGNRTGSTSPSEKSSGQTNMFTSVNFPYDTVNPDSEFSYTWSKNVEANSTTEFSTLIGLGSLTEPTINIESLEPNYNTDTKEFNLTTDDKNVIISGTITDECGMGACTYNINGEDIPCDQATYYTSGTDYSTKYTATIPTEKLTDVNENTFSVTANSVACGTATDTTTFTLHKDRENNKQTGINNNYIALGVILLGGIGLFIYSRKQNKFPQA